MPTTSEDHDASARVAPDPVIILEQVSVRYRLPRERITSIKDYAIRRIKGQIRFDEFWALRDVSFEVHKGETLGIIGHNGAGKTTLLRLVARVLKPTGGRVWVKGRVAPLLGLGSGFDPELTGRENIFLNGTLLGSTEEDLRRRFDRIVEFAGVGDFIDLPLRRYSSGMMARLGFAIATDVQPDVLILDEVFAVGDEEFRQKSTARMESLRKNGDAILFVSHGLDAVRRLCHRVAWLHHGRLRAIGSPGDVIEQYREAAGGQAV